MRSVASNMTGIAIGWTTLLIVTVSSSHALMAALGVGIGSALMIQASRLGLISVAPAIVFGYASVVSTSVATQHPVTTEGIHNPFLIAAATHARAR